MTTIDADARETLIDTLETYPPKIQTLIVDVSDDDLRRAGPDGSWGAVEVLCHLRDLEDLFLERMQRIVDENNPALEFVEDSLWPIERDYLNQDPHQALDDFTALRRQSVNRLAGMDVADWGQVGRHPIYGQLNIQEFAERVIQRDDEYENLLRQALRREAVS